MRGVPLPEKAAADSLHIATAAVHGMKYLLTWNCTHIANVVLRHWAKTSGAALASGILACAMAKLAPSASQAVICRVTVNPASGTVRWWCAGLQGIMAVKSVSAIRVSRQFKLGLHALSSRIAKAANAAKVPSGARGRLLNKTV